MSNFFNNMVNTGRKFTAIDFAIFKICLLAVGALLGVYFTTFLSEYLSIIWIVAITTYVAIMVQVVRYYRKRDR